MKKVSFTVDYSKKELLDFIIRDFENVSYFPKNNGWDIEIFTLNKLNEDYLLKKNLQSLKNIKVDLIENKNWLLVGRKNQTYVNTELFCLSQGFFGKKKYSIIIPGGMAFGTGRHESTQLAIRGIEFILKKNKINNCFDLGSGSGILSFAVRLITKKKVISCDCDKFSEDNYNFNMKLNNLNGLFFLKCDGFRHRILKKKRFDLIVANIFLNPLKSLARDINKHLTSNGFVIISGILNNQKNEIINNYYKNKLKLVKKNTLGDWSSLIFQKFRKAYE